MNELKTNRGLKVGTKSKQMLIDVLDTGSEVTSAIKDTVGMIGDTAKLVRLQLKPMMIESEIELLEIETELAEAKLRSQNKLTLLKAELALAQGLTEGSTPTNSDQ